WYQKHMLTQARQEKFQWAVWAGWIGLPVAFVLIMMMGYAATFVHNVPVLALVFRGLQFLSFAPLLSPLGGYLLRNYLGSQYNPKKEDVEARKERGRRRAMRRKEFARLATRKEGGKGVPSKLRMEDL